ncbi:BA75_01323T0 [Komagataella pastoris]|uniref:BA75_01323T0 n=1 Tax=Komagataella pastoris TaxID=4922 RepID=A0A1B2J7S1_PICPA|nr:BA75_01323T0 [Komagataella pastoris]
MKDFQVEIKLENDDSSQPSQKYLMETVTIKDLESGQLDIDLLLSHISLLKEKLSHLRYQMVSSLKLLASVDNSTGPSGFFQTVSAQVSDIKRDIEDYHQELQKVLPVVRFCKIKMGLSPNDSVKVTKHEVKIQYPNGAGALVGSVPGSNDKQDRRVLQQKKTAVRKPRKNIKKTPNINQPGHTPSSLGNANGNAQTPMYQMNLQSQQQLQQSPQIQQQQHQLQQQPPLQQSQQHPQAQQQPQQLQYEQYTQQDYGSANQPILL